MTTDTSALLKALFAAGAIGLFAVAVAAPDAPEAADDDGTPDQGPGDN